MPSKPSISTLGTIRLRQLEDQRNALLRYRFRSLACRHNTDLSALVKYNRRIYNDVIFRPSYRLVLWLLIRVYKN